MNEFKCNKNHNNNNINMASISNLWMHKMNHIVISTEHSFTQTHSRAQSKQITFNIDMNSRSENRVMLVKGETHQLYNKKMYE